VEAIGSRASKKQNLIIGSSLARAGLVTGFRLGYSVGADEMTVPQPNDNGNFRFCNSIRLHAHVATHVMRRRRLYDRWDETA